jgi:hypothetical protein
MAGWQSLLQLCCSCQAPQLQLQRQQRGAHQCGLEADANQVHARPVLAAARPAAIVDGRLDGLDAAAQQQGGGAPVQPLVHSG